MLKWQHLQLKTFVDQHHHAITNVSYMICVNSEITKNLKGFIYRVSIYNHLKCIFISSPIEEPCVPHELGNKIVFISLYKLDNIYLVWLTT